MLHTTAVYPATLAILKKMMELPEMSHFCLVGGTALALQIGHRISVDLDLFTTQNFDNQFIINSLNKIGKVENIIVNPNILQFSLEEVKVDIVKYPYNFIENYLEIEGIRLLPIELIAVMKLVAISNRGAKKDFVDMYFLLDRYNLDEILINFEQIFPQINTFHAFKALTYFDDADIQTNPVMLKNVKWEEIKMDISKKVEEYLRKS